MLHFLFTCKIRYFFLQGTCTCRFGTTQKIKWEFIIFSCSVIFSRLHVFSFALELWSINYERDQSEPITTPFPEEIFTLLAFTNRICHINRTIWAGVILACPLQIHSMKGYHFGDFYHFLGIVHVKFMTEGITWKSGII